jgi:hypothetical protein
VVESRHARIRRYRVVDLQITCSCKFSLLVFRGAVNDSHQIMQQQVEGGDLVVNRGNESRPKDGSSRDRDFNAVYSHDAALKLTEVRFPDLFDGVLTGHDDRPTLRKW